MEFNAEQRAAIETEARNALVLAGAGTGKTRTIIGRAAHLLENGVDPARIIIVTFTRRAAREIQQRLQSSAGTRASQVVSGTFHHLCLRIMSARRKWFEFQDLTVMDRDDQTQLMKLVRGEVVGRDAVVPQAPQLLSYYSYARNTNQSPKAYLQKYAEVEGAALEKVVEIFASYKQRKQAGGYLDYDDILHQFAKVLRKDEEVRRKVCSQYDHVLVDEMQDTNPLQWLILEAFAEYCKLFCVGDDAQSIYAFRGADFENVHAFDDRLPESSTLKLQENYRSTQEILDLANWLLEVSKLDYQKRLQANRGSGEKPTLLDFSTDFEEAAWIAETIQQRQSEGAKWSEHMILCRSAYAARPIEAELIEEKIPYRFVGGMSLLQMAHVRDLLSVLRSVLNYRDELAWVRFLTLWPRIGEVTATRAVNNIVTAADLEEALERLRGSLKSRSEILAVPEQLKTLLSEPAKAIQTARKHLEPMLEKRYDNWDNRKRDLDLIERLAGNHRSLAAFLETYTLDPISATEATPEQNADEGLVTLITIHSAKGTECEVCFVPALQPGNYPHNRSLGDEDEIEEERRVLYVALTRAKDHLYLSRHLSRGYGRTSWNSAAGSHYFLSKLPPQYVQTGDFLMSSFDLLEDDVL